MAKLLEDAKLMVFYGPDAEMKATASIAVIYAEIEQGDKPMELQDLRRRCAGNTDAVFDTLNNAHYGITFGGKLFGTCTNVYSCDDGRRAIDTLVRNLDLKGVVQARADLVKAFEKQRQLEGAKAA